MKAMNYPEHMSVRLKKSDMSDFEEMARQAGTSLSEIFRRSLEEGIKGFDKNKCNTVFPRRTESRERLRLNPVESQEVRAISKKSGYSIQHLLDRAKLLGIKEAKEYCKAIPNLVVSIPESKSRSDIIKTISDAAYEAGTNETVFESVSAHFGISHLKKDLEKDLKEDKDHDLGNESFYRYYGNKHSLQKKPTNFKVDASLYEEVSRLRLDLGANKAVCASFFVLRGKTALEEHYGVSVDPIESNANEEKDDGPLITDEEALEASRRYNEFMERYNNQERN